MLCLTRYLSLIIGDLIPKPNKSWKLYLILREILGIITSPRYLISDIFRLTHLIRKQNELYMELFGSLKPKMHLGTHLPNIMRRNGPLIHFWGMIGERKNKNLKEVAVNTTTNKNLPLTVAIKNQLMYCQIRQSCKNLKSYIDVGSVQSECDIEIKKYISVQSAKTYNFINICGKKYSRGTIIVTKVDDNGPQFGMIEKIFEVANEFYFSVSEINIMYYCHRYQAYKVNVNKEQTTLFKCKSLPKIGPCLLVDKEDAYYIATRYEI